MFRPMTHAGAARYAREKPFLVPVPTMKPSLLMLAASLSTQLLSAKTKSPPSEVRESKMRSLRSFKRPAL